MRLKSVLMEGHPALGSFKYDFEEDKKITVLVGNNGCGKTQFIKAIRLLLESQFTRSDINRGQNVNKVEINISLSEKDLEKLDTQDKNLAILFDLGAPINPMTNAPQVLRVLNADSRREIVSGSPSYPHSILPALLSELRSKLRFSRAELTDEEPRVGTPSKSELDSVIETESPKNSLQELTQLLVNLDKEDREKRDSLAEEGKPYPKIEHRRERFINAWNILFQESIKFVDIRPGDEPAVIFKNTETKKEFPIKDLSSGQQRVICRIGYLLKNLNIREGGIVFIDEPELSLHPKWQEKYIEFLKAVLGDDVQIIIATHSPYIIKSAIDDEDVSISKLEIKYGNLIDKKLQHTSALGKATFAEVSYEAFDIASEAFHTELYLALQRKYSPEKWDSNHNPPKYVDGTPKSLDKEISNKKDVTKLPVWTDVNSNEKHTETIMTFIRNIINHGQDAITRGRGRKYTSEELEVSIKEMLRLLNLPN